jgi:uncharacterized protein (UPF0333 family)
MVNQSSRSSKLLHASKAQVSMEYLIIFTIAFMMTLPLIVIYSQQTQNVQADVTQVQIYKLATKISDYAEQVYYMGEPSQRTLIINFPKGINSVTIAGNNILFNVTTTDLTYTVLKETTANLTGSIETFEGPHTIVFKAEANLVDITER